MFASAIKPVVVPFSYFVDNLNFNSIYIKNSMYEFSITYHTINIQILPISLINVGLTTSIRLKFVSEKREMQ